MAAYVPITADFLNTPRRKVDSTVGSKTSAMLALPTAPVEKKELVPMSLVVNTNSALVVEMEKVNVKLDLISKNLVEFEAVIMDGVGAVVPSVPVPEVAPLTAPVPPVDMAVTNTLMMRQYDEMRRVMASEQEKTRVYMKNWAVMMAVLVFLMTIIVVSHVHVIVYMLKEPAVCEPCRECAVVNDWIMAKCFAQEFV
jgi:hypothetical protein